jgi:moderate conductance mechanosensitive channel
VNEVTEEAGLAMDRLDQVGIALEGGFRARLQNLVNVGNEWDTLVQGLNTGGHSLGTFLAVILGAVLVSAVAFYGARRVLQGVIARSGRFSSFIDIATVVLTVLVVTLVFRLIVPDGTLRQVARFWAIATLIGLLVQRLVTGLLLGRRKGGEAGSQLASFAKTLSLGFAWSLFGLAALATLRVWNAGSGLRDLVGTFLVGLPAFGLLAYAYWAHRRAVAAAVAGPEPRTAWRERFAGIWPTLAILALIGTFVALQVAATVGRPLPGLAMLGSLLLVLVSPHIDSVIRAWSERRAGDLTSSLLAATLRRMTRFAFAILVLGLLIYLWALPALTSLGFDVTLIRAKAVEIVIVALVGALLWNGTAAGIERVEARERRTPAATSEDDVHAPRTRLATLLPLLNGTAKIGILVLSILTMLVILDVNVWPLITGLSVFGLALGFGSQTLVKDIVSGLFFLLDDAFRMGEYIETSGAKGTVERISVRSVSLRHPRGAVATIPYGQIGKIQNFSRDWVIEKLVFRVAFDTDVEKVRKLFKQIGQEIAADPELNEDLMETFKSQGIASVEDGTLLVRGKFKAKAGKQFGIRKAVLSAVQRAFRENGIQAVPRPIPAPPGAGSAPS